MRGVEEDDTEQPEDPWQFPTARAHLTECWFQHGTLRTIAVRCIVLGKPHERKVIGRIELHSVGLSQTVSSTGRPMGEIILAWAVGTFVSSVVGLCILAVIHHHERRKHLR